MVFFTPTLAVFILYYLYKSVSYNNSFNDAKGISRTYKVWESSKFQSNYEQTLGDSYWQPPVVQKLDSAIPCKNHYPGDKYLGNQLRYPLDIYLSLDSVIHLFNNWGHCT